MPQIGHLAYGLAKKKRMVGNGLDLRRNKLNGVRHAFHDRNADRPGNYLDAEQYLERVIQARLKHHDPL